MPFHNDEPTLRDLIGRADLLKEVTDAITKCRPPQVFGIHGDWGAGKTSFLHQLYEELTHECPQNPGWEPLTPAKRKARGPNPHEEDVTAIWFEAWRYQREPEPIVPLLQEIRTQLPLRAKFLRKAGKLFEVTTRSALLAFEGVTKAVGIAPSKIQEEGEKWETRHFATTLPSHMIREQLQHALGELLGSGGKKRPELRLVVLVDDLDRCESEAAYRLLEGIKVYLNLPNCVFVLGMNQQVVQEAVAKHLAKGGDETVQLRRAREYVEKLCQTIIHLPLVREPATLLGHWLPDSADHDAVRATVRHYKCLPANPRKIKAFANAVQRFVEQARHPWEPSITDAEVRMRLLVVLACLYQFKPELYQTLEGWPAFWIELHRWATGRPTKHPLLVNLEGRYTRLPADEAEKEPVRAGEREEAFLDPAQAHVLRLEALIDDIGELEPDHIVPYLLR